MQPLSFRKISQMYVYHFVRKPFYLTLFRNPLVPCDSITIPIVDLHPWQDGYKPDPPVKVSSLSRPSDPVDSPAPPISPYNYHHQPILTQSPAPIFSQSHFNSLANTPIKSFIHSPLPSYNQIAKYKSL